MSKRSYTLSRSALLAMGLLAVTLPASAMPSFTTQTGQSCSACHVGSFGPHLTAYGRDFKLAGYVDSDGGKHLPPLSAMLSSSFTHTDKSQAEDAARGFGKNNNFALDQVSLFYAGAITSNAGAFIQTTYDGVGDVLTWDNADVRYARRGALAGSDFVYGVTANNNPTSQDLWNSTPAWGFPYSSSALAPTPANASLLDGGLAQQVFGAGLYGLWNNLVYAEFTAYGHLSRGMRKALGANPTTGTDSFDGVMPYWRLALQHDFNAHYVQVGVLGMDANRSPGGDTSSGVDHITDVGLDANYQWTGDPDNLVSAHAIFLDESQTDGASEIINGTNHTNRLSTFRADVSYSIDNTYTPSIQFFQTWGTKDAALWGTGTGRPDSQGITAEVAYVPFGKPDSPLPWLNGRVALQYTAYTKFDGTADHAADNNTLFLNVWLATDVFAGRSL